MRIAFYSDTYLPAVDGVVTSMLLFKKELERRGHKVFIFAPATPSNKKKYSSKDVFLYTGIRYRPYPQYSSALFPYASILKLSKLDIDLIHAQTPFTMGFAALLISKLADYPIAGSFHTLVNHSALKVYYPRAPAPRIKKFYSKYLFKYAKFFYRRCDTTIAPSKSIASMLSKYKIKHIAIVPNGIDEKVFNAKVDPEPAINAFGLNANKKLVLYQGRVSKEKNIEAFIKAASVLAKKRDDVEFAIGGTGPFVQHYVRLAKRANVKIKFLGFVSPELLPSLYAASSALCMPSKFETQGIVCLEAMAEGKPVIGANTPVLSEFIKPGYNGELFNPDNYLDCAKKIEKVLNNSSEYKKGATSTAHKFSIKDVTTELIKVYKETIKRRFAEQ